MLQQSEQVNKPNNIQPPILSITETAQAFCNPEVDAGAKTDQLEQGLRQHYKAIGMDPVRSEYLVLRGVWNCLQAPIMNAIEVDMIRHVLPRLENGEPLAPPEVATIKDFDGYFRNAPYKGPYLDFMRAAGVWAAGATERIIRQIDSDSTHWCHTTWKLFCNFHPLFVAAEREVRAFKRAYGPYEHFRYATGADANETSLMILGPALQTLDDGQSQPQEVGRQRLLAREEELSWGASIHRKHLTEIPLDPAIPLEKPLVKACPAASQSIWHGRTTLTKGRRRIPGSCPADISIIVPEEEAHIIVEALFAQAEKDGCIGERKYGRLYGEAKAAELRIIFCSYLLCELAGRPAEDVAAASFY